jgi:hypothetical protein
MLGTINLGPKSGIKYLWNRKREEGSLTIFLPPPPSLLGLEYRQGYLDVQVYPSATKLGRLAGIARF